MRYYSPSSAPIYDQACQMDNAWFDRMGRHTNVIATLMDAMANCDKNSIRIFVLDKNNMQPPIAHAHNDPDRWHFFVPLTMLQLQYINTTFHQQGALIGVLCV